MIPYDLDPSLHTTEPAATVLDDGLSPPPQAIAGEDDPPAQHPQAPVDPALWAKSEF